MKTLAKVGVIAIGSLVAACSVAAEEKTSSSEHAQVANVDHMIRRADGTFDVYCVDGSVEHGVTDAKIAANDVCNNASASGCPAATVPAVSAWKPPVAGAARPCTAADIALLQTTAKQPDVSFDDLESALKNQSAACAQCVFTTGSDASWGPFVSQGTSGTLVNWGSCFARAAGGTDACGEAFHKTNACAQDICSQCASQDMFGACYGKSFTNAATCGQYHPDTVCGASYATLQQACGSVWDVIKVVCGG